MRSGGSPLQRLPLGAIAGADPRDAAAGCDRGEERRTRRLRIEHLIEPDRATLLHRLLPQFSEVRIYRALLEAAASEHGARMTAMDSATNNAAKMIFSLTLAMNRARQAAITKELMEIVSGAEALKG